MTRINLVDPDQLINKHLIAEYKELPRVFGLVRRAVESGRIKGICIPKEYTMGTGHVVFFYNKLGFLERRWDKIRQEMEYRGINVFLPSLKEMYQDIPDEYYGDYEPTPKAIKISVDRLLFRMKQMGVLK